MNISCVSSHTHTHTYIYFFAVYIYECKAVSCLKKITWIRIKRWCI